MKGANLHNTHFQFIDKRYKRSRKDEKCSFEKNNPNTKNKKKDEKCSFEEK